jgi:hypothetical protein
MFCKKGQNGSQENAPFLFSEEPHHAQFQVIEARNSAPQQQIRSTGYRV